MFLFQTAQINLPNARVQAPTINVDETLRDITHSKTAQPITRADSRFEIMVSPPEKVKEALGKWGGTALKTIIGVPFIGGLGGMIGGGRKDPDRSSMVYLVRVPKPEGETDFDTYVVDRRAAQTELIKLAKLINEKPSVDFVSSADGFRAIDSKTKSPLSAEFKFNKTEMAAYGDKKIYEADPALSSKWDKQYSDGLAPLEADKQKAKNEKNKYAEKAANAKIEVYKDSHGNGYEMFKKDFSNKLVLALRVGNDALEKIAGVPGAPQIAVAVAVAESAAASPSISKESKYIPPKFKGTEEDRGGVTFRSSIESNKIVMRFLDGEMTPEELGSMPSLGKKQLHELLGISKTELPGNISAVKVSVSGSADTQFDFSFLGQKDGGDVTVGPVRINMTELNRGEYPGAAAQKVINAIASAVGAKIK